MHESGEINIGAARAHQKPIDLRTVLNTHYPEINIGRVSEPRVTLFKQLTDMGIEIDPVTLSSYREGSRSAGKYNEKFLARLLLMHALLENKEWVTPTVFDVSSAIINAVDDIVQGPYSLAHWGLRRSSGITPALAEFFNASPGTITKLIAGIRIDGAYIALRSKEANEKLLKALTSFADTYLGQPSGVQKEAEYVRELGNAHDARQAYSAIYGRKEYGFRRVGALVPYEVDYWKWLLESQHLRPGSHASFTDIVLQAYAHRFEVIQEIRPWILRDTGIVLGRDAINTRLHLMQADIPQEYFSQAEK